MVLKEGFLPIILAVLATTPWWGEIVDRASKSYDVAVGQYEKRVAAGLQPSTPVINLFSVAHQERVLLLGNLGYLLTCFVLYVIMSKREKAFQLKRALTVYNLINVLVSGFVAFSILRYKLNEEPRVFVCNRGGPGESGLAYIFVLFYLQKFVEFMDTYAFILRKSFRQVTTLHLFHHASITVIVGSLLPFDYSGDMFMPILLNSVVHVMVYLHYFLTCIGLHSWWSPYLTSLQMGQFAFIFVHSSLAFLKGPDCGSPDFAKLLLMAYMGSMLLLFSDFFVRRYILHQPSYDMCGVIKSNHRGGPTCTTYYGNATLNESGEALVRMPRSFREFSPLTIVNYCYQLTPLNGPMPDLHVLKEVRFRVRHEWSKQE